MSLYRRKDSPYWWIKLSHDGRSIQRSAGTPDRKKAREYHDKLKAQLWDLSRLGVKPSHTWEEAVVRWLDEKSHKASLNDDKRNFVWLHSHLTEIPLEKVDRDCVDRITQARRKTGVSNGTVNRTLSLLRSVLRAAAHDWEWLERVPKVRLLPERKGRTRYLTAVEAQRLLAELPEHLATLARFAMLTGLRQRNVRELSWSQVDLGRRLVWERDSQPADSRGGGGRACPGGKARAVRIHVSRQADSVGEQYRMEGCPQACGYQGLSVARSATLLGDVSHASGYAAPRSSGARRMGITADGPAICSPHTGAPCRTRRCVRRPREIGCLRFSYGKGGGGRVVSA